MYDYVDFSEYDNIIEDNKNQNHKTKYTKNGKIIIYNDKTTKYYCKLREMKMDPILQEEISDNISFKFYYQWDPYTGKRLEKDPYGPLYFHPDILIKYFYTSRLNDLWVNETEDNDEYYEGYYDAAVGAGEDIYIHSRGFNPDKYLFRLPVNDCYWLSDLNNFIVVTMGPKLTNDEVKRIDELAHKCGNYYYKKFGVKRPSLVKMKKLYDQAISKKPILNKDEYSLDNINEKEKEEIYRKINRQAVDNLRKMIG